MAPSPAALDRRTFTELAPPSNPPHHSADHPAHAASTSPAAQRLSANTPASSNTPNPIAPRPARLSGSRSPTRTAQAPKSSPPSASRSALPGPRIVVKKEPRSPVLPSTRHRPRKLDLSKGNVGSGAATARPALGARDSLGIQEVGLACLSPGFMTQDPVMQEHLQQSLNVREQQRRIIEARLQQQSGKGDSLDSAKDSDPNQFAAKTPGMSRRNKAPAGLSIVAPSHEQFANERVIQSAPLGQTFTGRNNPHPLSRHLLQQPAHLSNASHIQHNPAHQTANRLPPISDVFGSGLPVPQDSNGSRQLHPGASHAPMASPGLPPAHHSQGPQSARPREYKSAEEAQHEISGGRPELLPKLVHYTGHQPPTPPSPRSSAAHDAGHGMGKRRTRAEYEDGASPPLGHGRSATRRGPFGAGRDSPETQRQKREEFLQLCERAWDLFHS
ncbi:uncharacterized protein B0I36DRAFT_358202 [Microdochium trichocladiopsis]|uniref:Uncharacterized protein n=1 Tax=Microdochium trichocladiopsis TaxID=1682393 RepID=A0A9P8YIG1_9PEZI|nr:uncharacterized protein B0I36DRAFT_358202 [Microdochium trichocladiopsis]KAH7040984.1 hypothetical protein B0I36DRAFT_358202 [Microdochium trichocladiopsis]